MSNERNRRVPREERRNLNIEESYSLGFVDMQERQSDDGWPYDDCDDEETTEDRPGARPRNYYGP